MVVILPDCPYPGGPQASKYIVRQCQIAVIVWLYWPITKNDFLPKNSCWHPVGGHRDPAGWFKIGVLGAERAIAAQETAVRKCGKLRCRTAIF